MRLELQAVGKRFGRTRALADVTVTVPAGRRVALVGPNGSGKSTLIRILLGLLSCEGTVRLDGRSPREEQRDIARQLAYVPQLPPQLGASVREIVTAVARLRGLDEARVEAYAARLGLALSAVEGRPFRDLSGGTKHKLLLAIAFAAGATLLILDEPTASLDTATRERFLELLSEVGEQTTVVLCSHHLDEVRHAVDHVLQLDEGRVAYDGPLDGLVGSQGASRVELRVAGSHDDGWLREHGFRRGAAGWWSAGVSAADHGRVVREVAVELGPRLDDLLVHRDGAPGQGGPTHG